MSVRRNPSSLWLSAVLPFVCAVGMPLLPAMASLGYPLAAAVMPSPRFVEIVTGAFIVATLASAVGLALRWRAARHDRGVVIALIAFVAAYAVIPLVGIEPTSSFKYAAAATMVAVAVLSCSEVAAVDRLRRAWVTAYVGAGAIAVAYAVVIAFLPSSIEGFVYAHGRAYGLFLQPNELAAYTLFLIPVGIVSLLADANLFAAARAMAAATVLIGALGLALSGARAAWLGALVGLATLAARFGRRIIAAGAVTLAVIAVVGALWPSARHDPSENLLRIGVWGGAVRVVERYALTGTGPGNFAQAYERLRLPSAETSVLHAHDLPLNLLAENGVFGFAVAVWLIVASVAAVRRARASAPQDPARTALYAALVAGFVASALQSIAHVTMFMVLWAPMLGMLLGLGRRPAAEPS